MKTMGVADLADATEVDAIGSKAAHLGELVRAGFEVPAASVLPATMADAAVADAVVEALHRLKGDRFAVRSSAVAEDTCDASFAGQYESFLGVSRSDVAAAVLAVRASGGAGRVASYREQRGLGDAASPVAVIVQQLVDAVAAGVAFSADPVTGIRDRVLVSAVKGLGDRLVSGQAAADEWYVEAGQATCRAAPESAVDAETVLRVAALACAAAAHFGAPQDIEWAIDASGKLYLLQARPITALPEPVRWEAPDSGSYRRNYHLGEWFFEPLTPLFDDWLVRRLEARMHEVAHRHYGHIPLLDRYHVLVNGWYFMDIGFLPDNPLALLATIVRHQLPRAIRNPRRLAMFIPPMAPFSVRPHYQEYRSRFEPEHRRLVASCQARASVANADELVTIVDRVADDAGEYDFYIGIVGGFAWKFEVKLARFCNTHLAGSGLTSHQELLLACRPPEAEPQHVTSLDWYRMDLATAPPEPAADAQARRSRLLTRRLEAESGARSALAGRPKLLKRFDRLLSVAREFAAIREEQVAGFTAGWPIMALSVRRLGEDLVRRKVLTEAAQVHFLTRGELIAAAGDLSSAADARRSEWEQQRRLSPPLKLGPDPFLFRRMMDDSVDAFRSPREASGEEVLRGMPCSPGVARGRVRIVSGPEAFDTFEAGEVLVAQTTTPGWTPLFARAAAVVTDVGSVMAHASLVAREFGIPAVVGAGDATQKLRNGMLVTVDGSAGVVLEET
jgi:pyruvate,water dikinase